MAVQQTPGSSSEASSPEPAPADPAPVDPERAGSTAEQRHPIDKVIFGVSAALVVAFIVWGLASVDTLSAVAGAVLDGLMTGGGWAFVLAASGFVVFALWVAFSR